MSQSLVRSLADERGLRAARRVIPWQHVVALAEQLEREATATGQPDVETGLRLARSVLEFQNELLGLPRRGR